MLIVVGDGCFAGTLAVGQSYEKLQFLRHQRQQPLTENIVLTVAILGATKTAESDGFMTIDQQQLGKH